MEKNMESIVHGRTSGGIITAGTGVYLKYWYIINHPLRYSDGKLSIAIETPIPEMAANDDIDIKAERNMSMAMA